MSANARRAAHLKLTRKAIENFADIHWPLVLDVVADEAAAEQRAYYWRDVLIELKATKLFYADKRRAHNRERESPVGDSFWWEIYIGRRKR
jgi:hypothetical protein